MAKPWDDTFKKLVRMSPQAFVNFLLPSAHFVKTHSHVIEQEELEMDGLLEVIVNGKPMLLNIEFQTRNDSTMAERLLRYNVLARIYYGIPVYSCVIHLLDDGAIAQSPLVWDVPVKPEMLHFDYECIELSKISPNDVLQIQETVLLPLISLTKGGDSRQEIQHMFKLIETRDDVSESDKRELGLTAFTLAALMLHRKKNDAILEWLIRRFQIMHEALSESPIIQMIMQEGREQGLEKGLEKGRVEEARAMLVYFVEARFPQLKEVAREQATLIESQKVLEKLAFAMGIAQAADEAMQSLIEWKTRYKDLL